MKKPSLGFIICMFFFVGGPLLIYLDGIIHDKFFAPWARLPAAATDIQIGDFFTGIDTPVIMKARLVEADFLRYVKKEGYTLGKQADLERFYRNALSVSFRNRPYWWTPPKKPDLIAYKGDEYGMAVIIFKDGWLFYQAGMFP